MVKLLGTYHIFGGETVNCTESDMFLTTAFLIIEM